MRPILVRWWPSVAAIATVIALAAFGTLAGLDVPALAMVIATISPRLLNRDQAAGYLGVSADTVDRLIDTGAISLVKLPVARARKNGNGVAGSNRRVLIDRAELDSLIPKWRERRDQ